MATGLQQGANDRDFVRSLRRGLEVVGVLGHSGPEMTLTEVARAIGASRASTRRSLHTLQVLGYVHCDGERFSLTPKVLSLGHGYRSRLTLPEVAQPHLQRLTDATGEFSSVSVLDGDETVCVACVVPTRIMNIAMPVGSRLPAYATCVGRVLLANLAPAKLKAYFDRVELNPLTAATITSASELRTELVRVRRQHWALVDQEVEQGLRSAAAPVRDTAGNVIAAANIGTPAGRITVATLRTSLVPSLAETAASIERDLAVARP
jgi:IclR family pca regulon transcriptional regulator